MIVRASGVRLAAAAALAAVGLAQCNGAPRRAPAGDEAITVADTAIIAAQEALTDEIIDLEGVAGTAVGLCGDAPCIKVYLEGASPEIRGRIPDTYRGFRVDVEITGELRARGDG